MSHAATFTIYVSDDPFGLAPARMRYRAAFSPLDEGDHHPYGEGPTIEAAVMDLIENYDRPWDEPTQAGGDLLVPEAWEK